MKKISQKLLLCITIILLLFSIFLSFFKIYQREKLEQASKVSSYLYNIMELSYLSNDLYKLLNSNSTQRYRILLINSTLYKFRMRWNALLHLEMTEDFQRMTQFFDDLSGIINKLEIDGDYGQLDEVLELKLNINTSKISELFNDIYEESDNFKRTWESYYGNTYYVGDSLKEYKTGIELMHNYVINLIDIYNEVIYNENTH